VKGLLLQMLLQQRWDKFGVLWILFMLLSLLLLYFLGYSKKDITHFQELKIVSNNHVLNCIHCRLHRRVLLLLQHPQCLYLKLLLQLRQREWLVLQDICFSCLDKFGSTIFTYCVRFKLWSFISIWQACIRCCAFSSSSCYSGSYIFSHCYVSILFTSMFGSRSL
jgi:hypothetical protein